MRLTGLRLTHLTSFHLFSSRSETQMIGGDNLERYERR